VIAPFRNVRKLPAIILLFAFFQSQGQTGPTILIGTRNTDLVFTIGTNHRIYQLYLGKRPEDTAVFSHLKASHEAYPGAGMEDLLSPAIRLIHADGNPSLDLQYVEHHSTRKSNDIEETAITLRDPVYPVEVVLHFIAYYNEDVISSHAEIRHHEKKPVVLTQYASSFLHFDADHYWLTQFHGDWAREMDMQESELTSGIKIIDSKLGVRANLYQSPMFFLSLGQAATETSGELIAGTLAWTGNFQFLFETDSHHSLRVSAGMNPYASEYTLEPEQSFLTPEFLFTYSAGGKGLASRNLHRWARDYGVLDGHAPRLTLLNNWETTYFDFDQSKLTKLFDGAADMGVDLFLLDDGWFGNKYPRDNDKAGLGDWQENKKKLPDGIGYLVKEAGKKGLKFGIWLEPEMVNPKSELYEQHPDWILKLPNRPESYSRNQLVLDLVNPKVQDFVFHLVDDLLTRNPGLAYIKWDCNRPMTNDWSPTLKEHPSHLFIEYTRSLYKVLDRIRAKYPHLPMMLCSGGGGRTDYGALRYFTEFWPSDNTDGLERIFIQWGYSYFFPANTIAAHVTNSGKTSLKFRTDVAMMDKLGYDIKVGEMTPTEMQFTREALRTYKRLSETIWQGDLYRLVSPYAANRAVLQYVSGDKTKSVLFHYVLNVRRKEIFNRVRLEGLDPAAAYRVTEVDLYPGTRSKSPEDGKVWRGYDLMNTGLNLGAGGMMSLTSQVYEITKEPAGGK
jgi:alpha-galactosidase